jgi:hypothetical protein
MSSRNYKESQVSVEQIEVLVERIVILEDTIQMLSYNLRCLNIRQGSQPFELPNSKAEGEVILDDSPKSFYDLGLVDPDFNPENITFDLSGIHALDCMNGIRGSVDDLILLEDHRYQDKALFGADPIAWEK